MVVVFLGDMFLLLTKKIKSSVYTAVSQNEKNRNTQKTLIKRSKSIKASLDHLPPIVSELDVLRNQWICLLSNTKSVWLVYRKCIA